MSTKQFTYTLTANQSKQLQVEGDYYRIMSATGAVNVTRDGGTTLNGIGAGEGERKVHFQSLTLTDASGASNTITIIVGDDTYFNDKITLNQSTFDVRPLVITAGANSNAALLQNVAEAFVAAASNVNGMIVQSVSLITTLGSGQAVSVVVHTAPPTTVTQGIPLLNVSSSGRVAASPGPVRVPAGYGLYFFNGSGAGLVIDDVRRGATWTLL